MLEDGYEFGKKRSPSKHEDSVHADEARERQEKIQNAERVESQPQADEFGPHAVDDPDNEPPRVEETKEPAEEVEAAMPQQDSPLKLKRRKKGKGVPKKKLGDVPMLAERTPTKPFEDGQIDYDAELQQLESQMHDARIQSSDKKPSLF